MLVLSALAKAATAVISHWLSRKPRRRFIANRPPPGRTPTTSTTAQAHYLDQGSSPLRRPRLKPTTSTRTQAHCVDHGSSPHYSAVGVHPRRAGVGPKRRVGFAQDSSPHYSAFGVHSRRAGVEPRRRVDFAQDSSPLYSAFGVHSRRAGVGPRRRLDSAP